MKWFERKREETVNPSAGVVDARSVRGAPTVTSPTRGYDAVKKISHGKTSGTIDTMGPLIAVVVMVASVSDNVGGTCVMHKARKRSGRLKKIFCDLGFKRTFIKECQRYPISAEVVKRIHAHQFEALPRRLVVERTWSWLMNNRRLQIDYYQWQLICALTNLETAWRWTPTMHR